MSEPVKLSRRDCLKYGLLATGGLVLGCTIASDRINARSDSFAPNAFVSIDSDGIVTITVAKSEMGQGVRTTLPMIVAEELEADWSKVRVEQAKASADFSDMGTGGSSSVRDNFEPLRKAGATAKTMLIAAAAQQWGVSIETCKARNGEVVDSVNGRKLAYSTLVTAAAALPVPKDVNLKDSSQYQLLGKRIRRVDDPALVIGKSVYGIDAKLPGMLQAVIARSPIYGGLVDKCDSKRTLKIPGVRKVIVIPGGVAVVADSFWAAVKGREALQVQWKGTPAGLDTVPMAALCRTLASQPGAVAQRKGTTTKEARRLEADYEVPYLAHATMEPMNCLASVHPDRCEIWTGTQVPQDVQKEVAQLLKLPLTSVSVQVALLGGGFGRRLETDYVLEAVRVSQAMGTPVKVIWTREDDTRHGVFRPMSFHRLSAALDSQGKLVEWNHRIVSPSVLERVAPQAVRSGLDEAAIEGAKDIPYTVANVLVDYHRIDTAIPVGWWRAVYNVQNAFATECFLDETARKAGVDPLEFRLHLLGDTPRLKGVLELAAAQAGWNKPLPTGHFQGIACYYYGGCNTYVAEVAEITVAKDGSLKVHRVVCAVDCGLALNPNGIEAQMEGAIAYGLSAVLHGEITVEKGKVMQGNFDSYPVLRIDEMPKVEVHIVPSQEAPGGIGEPGVPPLAPAIANAVYAATGKRIRHLPIRLEDLRKE